MKNWIKNFSMVTATLMLVFAAACDTKEKVEMPDNPDGYKSGSLKVTPNIVVDIETKSVPTTEFVLKVYKAGTTDVARDINGKSVIYTCATVPAIVTLPVGHYELEAYSHDQSTCAWESPYYHGKTESFEIKQSEITEAGNVTCKFKNVKVTVEYGATLLSELKEFVVTVSNATSYLEFTRDENRAGYFKEGPLTVTLNGTRHDGEVVRSSKTYSDVEVGQHRHIELDVELKEDLTGFIEGSLSVDITTTLLEKDIHIPIVEPEYNEPGPGPDPDAPTIIGRGFDIKQDIVYERSGTTPQVIVDMAAESGIFDLWVDIDSDFIANEPGFEMLLHFNLADLSPELAELLGPNMLGLITGDPIRDANEVTFDISTFVPLLPAGEVHKFKLTLTDSEGVTVTETLTLKPY